MKCGRIREELVEAVLSGPEMESLAVREHLATCAACAQEVAALRRTMDLMDEWQAPAPSPYFSARLHTRMREERRHEPAGWLAWLRRPIVATAAAALLAVGVGMFGGLHWKNTLISTIAGMDSPQVANTGAAVSDLNYLDDHADLFSDFDALDDNQTETN